MMVLLVQTCTDMTDVSFSFTRLLLGFSLAIGAAEHGSPCWSEFGIENKQKTDFVCKINTTNRIVLFFVVRGRNADTLPRPAQG